MWGGEEATNSEIQKVWDDHLKSFAENNLPIPGWIWKEVEDFYSRPANQRHQQLNLEPEIDPSLLEPTEFAEEFNLNPDDDDEMDPDEVTIQWTRNHEWSVLHHTYADSTYLDAVSEKYKNLVDHFVAAPEAAVDEGKGAKWATASGMRDDCPSRRGARRRRGRQAGRVDWTRGDRQVNNNKRSRKIVEAKHGVGSVVMFATTGMSATVISGSTVHSAKHGLGLPVGRKKFTPLKGRWLKMMQDRFKDVVLALLDEYTMLRSKELYFMHKYFQQVFGNNLRDPAQIPCVLGYTLWDRRDGSSQ